MYLAVSGFFITTALVYTGGLQGTGDTRSPLYITLASQIAMPIGLCSIIQAVRPLAVGRHLAGDCARPLRALRSERAALSSGQVATHQGGSRGRARVSSSGSWARASFN